MIITFKHIANTNWIRRILVLLILSVLYVGNTFATTFGTRQADNWNDPATWSTGNITISTEVKKTSNIIITGSDFNARCFK